MTTIILTIIGILLAAAAALMVIFYGGDAFNGGSSRAKAVELTNMVDNIMAAQALYRAENGSYADSLSVLTDNNGKYLKGPISHGTIASELNTYPSGASVEVFAYDVYGETCPQINKMRKVPQMTEIPTAGDTSAPRMGCVLVNNFFDQIWVLYARS